MKISYCTSLKNRFNHFKVASNLNLKCFLELENEINTKHDFEWCIVDYDSTDIDLESYIKNLNSKFIVYKKIDNKPYYLRSHAKNICHLMASGEVVVNVDADNIITPNFHKAILDLFEKQNAKVAWPGNWPRITKAICGGGAGRIAMRKEVFEELGGYDEVFLSWGWEDMDIMHRAEKSNYPISYIDDTTMKFIHHGDGDRFVHNIQKSRLESSEPNKKYMLNKLKNKEFIANVGKKWGDEYA